jgi:hypothetical protein
VNESHYRAARITGSYWVEINGSKTECRSLKELLVASLRLLEQKRPGTLEKLSFLKKRTKRIVSLRRESLFDKKHLSQNYSENLMDGWWVGTNNSSDETQAWIERATECAGLKRGTEVRTTLGDRHSVK